MIKDNWKNLERNIARRIGTERTPLSGRNSRHDTSSDTLSKKYYIEAKWTGSKSSMFYPPWRECRQRGFFCYRYVPLIVSTILPHEPSFDLIVFDSRKMFDLDDICFKVPNINRFGVWKFFVGKVLTNARQEKKIPLMVIKFKGTFGEVIICLKKDFDEVYRDFKMSAKEKN